MKWGLTLAALACIVALLLARWAIPSYDEADAEAASHAADVGDVVKLTKLLDAHPDLANADGARTPGTRLLSVAALTRHSEIVRLLLERGANPNHLDQDDGSDWRAGTSLTWAVEGGSRECVDLLLEHAANPNMASVYGDLPLFAAFNKDDVETAKILIDHGADLSARPPDTFGPNTAIGAARSVAMLELLVAHGADVNLAWRGQTPLHRAAMEGDVRRIDYLLAHGANIEARGISGQTPLYVAAETGHLNSMKSLLGHGAVLDVQNSVGWTPLYEAVAYGHADVVEFLLNSGKSPDGITPGGFSPLHIAALHGQAAMATLLLSRGAQVDPKTQQWETPLHAAAAQGNLDVVRVLVEHGANVTSRTSGVIRLWRKQACIGMCRLKIIWNPTPSLSLLECLLADLADWELRFTPRL